MAFASLSECITLTSTLTAFQFNNTPFSLDIMAEKPVDYHSFSHSNSLTKVV
jgi:hypothetical protein